MKCLLCNCDVHTNNLHPESKNGKIHFNDYSKKLGFCSSKCFYKLPERDQRGIEINLMLNEFYRKLDKINK